MILTWIVHGLWLLAFPPLMLGVINKTKATLTGRRGPSVWQPYWDLWRLAHKGAVYSETTSWVFRLGPPVGLAGVLLAGLILPLAGARGVVSFAGDLVVFAYLLGLARFFTMSAALDTGSSFEGMGASREAAFASLVEPGLLLGLGVLAFEAHTTRLAAALDVDWASWGRHLPALLLVAAALLVVLLAENARLPVDDPATHLELTMVHEVMVLDHSGPDLAMIEYARAIKLFLFAALWAHVLLPFSGLTHWGAVALFTVGVLVVAALVGVIESTVTRIRLVRVPQFLTPTWLLGALALCIVLFLER